MAHVKKLRNRHYEIIRLAFMGEKQGDIAVAVGISQSAVSCILTSPLAQAELARLRSRSEEKLVDMPIHLRLRRQLEQAAVDSLAVNHAIVRNAEVSVETRRRAASHFLDKVVFSQEQEDKQEASYKDILRSLSTIERQLGHGVMLLPSVNGGASMGASNTDNDNGGGRAE